MKLGIAVVYLVLPGDEELIDLHLRYIEHCTSVPFTVYAATNRLQEPLVERLSARPFVRLCAMQPTDERGSMENAYYLEHLIAKAIQDGCTHVATLHVDSFPIHVGWETELDRAISVGYAFAAILREEDSFGKPSTACLFVPRSFYLRHRPQLLLSSENMQSQLERSYARKLLNPRESGAGYGFVAFKEDLRWLRLRRTNRDADHYYYGSIHGNLIFHLGASAHAPRSFPGSKEYSQLARLRAAVKAVLPSHVQRLLHRLIPYRVLHPETARLQRAHAQVKAALLANPTRFIARIRGAEDQAPTRVPGDSARRSQGSTPPCRFS